MKITIQEYDASEEDCKRQDYVTVVDGKEYLLAPSSLGSYYTYLEILAEVEKLFGPGVEIEWDCYIQKKPL